MVITDINDSFEGLKLSYLVEGIQKKVRKRWTTCIKMKGYVKK